MAVDTQEKRHSVGMMTGLPWMAAPLPTGTVDAAERASMGALYSGYTYAAGVTGFTAGAASPDYIGRALWQRP